MRTEREDADMEKREMRENQGMWGRNGFHCGRLAGRVRAGLVRLGMGASLLSLAVLLASCGSGSKGTDPQAEDSSGSVAVTSSGGGLHTSSSSGEAEPLSSGVVPGSSSGGMSTVSGSSGASSGGTQVRSSSSGGVVSSSSGAADCTWQCVDACEGTVIWSSFTTQSVCRSGEWVELSSSSVAKSSSSRGNMDNAFNKALSYGEFTDPRDGQKYRTIVIGYYQYEYFAENLNYGRQITGGTEQTDSTKYCYGDDPWYCENHYGGLYRWSTAMGFPAACDSVKTGSSSACPDTIKLPVIKPHQELAPQYPQVRGVCPDGWHVMNQHEWSDIVGGGVGDILSAVGWNRRNNSKGFSALPGGRFYSYGGAAYATYESMGTEAYFWLPQEQSDDALGARSVTLTSRDADNASHLDFKTNGLSVRCVKDHE